MTEINPLMQLANNYLESTNTVVFLTGKAGTGKTTFLQKLRQNSRKQLAVVAPTGVAAINAGGMTIHSFFQLPFGPVIPSGTEKPEAHFDKEKKELLGGLELLIIDEISMVRPDVLDQIDLILRNIKASAHPFGGVQLLLIGDLSQLSPIIREDEWGILRPYYNSPYFFSSHVMQKTAYVRIELDHVYRQKEQAFVNLLNEVRDQQMSDESLEMLNARYVPDFRPPADDPYITLTTHNAIAQQVNDEFLQRATGEIITFDATIRGDFPRDAYPTDTNLKLKIGAQVMFVKNDGSAEKLYYNGKIGTVSRIEGSTVYVICNNNEQELAVEAVEWTNIKYQLDGEAISESNAGSFAQLPLKLAWAITIHKSQGLTFDKAIIDVSESFAHGQAYVALSRCRTLSGMVLRNTVSARNIINDPVVVRFNTNAATLLPDNDRLEKDKVRYELFLLSELFNFGQLKNKLDDFPGLLPDFDNEVVAVAEKFNRKSDTGRSRQAAIYFLDKLQKAVSRAHLQLPATIAQSKEKAGKADQIINWLMHRIRLMEHFSQHPFTTTGYQEIIKSKITPSHHSYLKELNALPNEKFLEQLVTWRQQTAGKENIMPNMVLTEKTLAAIAEKLPATLKTLSGIKGVGPHKTTQYGSEIITLIRAYERGLQGAPIDQASLF